MRAALRQQRRAAAQAKAEHPSNSLVTAEERAEIERGAWTFMKAARGMLPRREKKRLAADFAARAIAELEQRKRDAARLVQPAQGGLIVTRKSLLITPDEARQIANQR